MGVVRKKEQNLYKRGRISLYLIDINSDVKKRLQVFAHEYWVHRISGIRLAIYLCAAIIK